MINLVVASCSSTQTKMAEITPASNGLLTGSNLAFPLYLTKDLKSKAELITATNDDVFGVFIGHIFDANKSKKENEESLKALDKSDYDLVNLTIEDLLIAEIQSINLDVHKIKFLNSSIIDIKKDNLYRSKKVVPYLLYKDTVFVGLSDNKTNDILLQNELSNSFIVNDYVLSILQARKLALNELKNINKTIDKKNHRTIKSFVIIHDLGPEMKEILERLPPHFLLTN